MTILKKKLNVLFYTIFLKFYSNIKNVTSEPMSLGLLREEIQIFISTMILIELKLFLDNVIYYYSKNIWYTIIIHAVYNGIQVVLYYLYLNNVLGFNIDNTSDVLWWQGLLSFLIASSLFYLLLQLLNKKS
jgi:hypothetical protein